MKIIENNKNVHLTDLTLEEQTFTNGGSGWDWLDAIAYNIGYGKGKSKHTNDDYSNLQGLDPMSGASVI